MPDKSSGNNVRAQAVAAPGAGDLLDEVLAEVRRLHGRRLAAGAARERDRGGPRDKAEQVAKSATNWGQVAAVAGGVVLVLIAAGLVIHHIRIGIREQDADAMLQRAALGLERLENSLQSADDLRAAKDYPAASKAYEAVIVRAVPLLRELKERTEPLRPGKLKDQLLALSARISEYRDQAEKASNAPDVRGLVLYEGEYVTPEEKERRFTKRMEAEGRRRHKGEWLTEEEFHRAQGEVLYKGRWVTPERRDRLLAAERKNRGREPVKQREPPPMPKPPVVTGDSSPDKQRWIIDDFEVAAHRWTNAPWKPTEANSCELATVSGSEGGQLQLKFKPGQCDKSAVVRPLGLDLRSRSRLVFDVRNNTGEPIRVAIAFRTDEYYESRSKSLRLGENKNVKFDLTSGDFKCAATNWACAAKLGRPESVSHLYILFYYNGTGSVLLDNIAALGGG